ncbi:MAG: hypothetical protein J5379_01635 [Clostridiales bacterium]|nr:hypothetical protein [Clostridiales bacterium]
MHKRPLVTAVSVFIAFVLIASIAFLSLGILSMSSDYPKVSVQGEQSGVISSGLGVNLSYIPSTNLVWDPSFENGCVEEVFSVAEAGGNAVYLHSRAETSELSGSELYQGGSLRIMSYDEDGQMSQIVQSKILDYQLHQLGIWKTLDIGTEINSEMKWIRSDGSYVLAMLQSGQIYADVTSSNAVLLQPVDPEDPFVDAVVRNSRYYAITEKGGFFASGNGKTWNSVPYGTLEPCVLHAVTVLGKMAVACGDSGQIRVCDMNQIYAPDSYTDNDLFTAVSDEKRVLLAGNAGYACTTVNGTVFRSLDALELPSDRSDTWRLSAYSEEEYVLVGQTGQIAIGTFDEGSGRFSFVRYPSSLPEKLVPKQLVMFPGGDIWLLTENGYIYAFSRSQEKWQQIFAERDNQIDSISKGSDEGILISRSGKLYSASMYTKVTIDQPIGDVEIQNGDMCLLSSSVPSLSIGGNGVWELYGDDSSAQIVSDAPKMAGNKALRISSFNPDQEKSHFVSQVISREETGPMQEKVFYHVRVCLKQNGLENEQVMVWISGLPEPIGTTFTGVNGNWKEYSFTFVWPENKVNLKENEIRLNVGFYGGGEVFVDAVRLEREAFGDTQIKPVMVRALKKASPEFIRLENLGLGRLGTDVFSVLPTIGNELLYAEAEGKKIGSGVVSLETTLNLVKQVEANPWLVIDSAFGADEMDVLLSYMCGGITDEYGKVRVDNGTAVPWHKQFERIMVEITDQNQLFETDLQRRAYVDYVIGSIKGSRFYSEIKDSVFFIDSMEYDSGTMMSIADYHSSSLTIDNIGTEPTEAPLPEEILAMTGSAYTDYYNAIPRNPSYIQEMNGEWINQLSFSIVRNRVSENQIVQDSIPVNAAEMVEFLLCDLGNHTSFVMVDLPVSRTSSDTDDDYLFASEEDTIENRMISSANTEVLLRTLGVINSAAQGKRCESLWTMPLSHQKEENYSYGLQSYAYSKDGYVYLIITNPTSEQKQFMLDTKTSRRDLDMQRYSAECKPIGVASSANFLKLGERRYTIQSGQFYIVVIPE